MSRDDSIVDDASSVGNKEEDDDDEDDANDDEKFEGVSGDPERLKAFNVSCKNLFFLFKLIFLLAHFAIQIPETSMLKNAFLRDRFQHFRA